jgi:hypothetical protein
MKKLIPYLLNCLIFFLVIVSLRILGIIFILNQEQAVTTSRDLISPLIVTAVWIVLMIVFKGFKKEGSQKAEV